MADGGGDDGTAFQVGDVLGFVNHVAGAMLGEADTGIGVVGVDPILVAGAAAGALSIKLADGLGVVRVDAGGGGEAFDIVPVLLLGVAVDEFAQRGVGLDDAGVDAKVAAFEQAVAAQAPEDEIEGVLIDFLAEAVADDR